MPCLARSALRRFGFWIVGEQLDDLTRRRLKEFRRLGQVLVCRGVGVEELGDEYGVVEMRWGDADFVPLQAFEPAHRLSAVLRERRVSLRVELESRDGPNGQGEFQPQPLERNFAILALTPPLRRFADKPCREVMEPDRRLDFISVLTAGSGTAQPFESAFFFKFFRR